MGNVIQVGLGEQREVGALGEVLARQAVCVLIGAALPGALGVAEVDLDAGIDAEARMGAAEDLTGTTNCMPVPRAQAMARVAWARRPDRVVT